MKVLICDDDQANRKFLSDAISLVDCAVVLAETGQQAIALAKQENPDLILMDHTMPEMMGYDAIKEIRKEPRLSSVPCVMITGDFEVQALQEDDKMQNCSFLPKPYSLDQLMTTIGKALGKKFP